MNRAIKPQLGPKGPSCRAVGADVLGGACSNHVGPPKAVLLPPLQRWLRVEAGAEGPGRRAAAAVCAARQRHAPKREALRTF